LLSLPQAARVRAAAADSVTPKTLPKRLSFTYPTFG
jgi:hypothetical protein